MEDTHEKALKELCWEVECLIDGARWYKSSDKAKRDKLWKQATKLVLLYGLYVSKGGKVSTTDDFEVEGTWFSFESSGLGEFIEC